MSEEFFSGDAAIYLAMIVGGFAVTYVWRFLGVLAVSSLHPESEILLWVRAVATAMIAALVARFVTAPSGLLADTPALARYGGIAVGLAVFAGIKRVEIATGAAIAAFFVFNAIG